MYVLTLVTLPVAGEAKVYSQVTDEDHELMTPEEYTAYFEIFQARSEG
jgi:transcription initiation factor TFIIE subunit alpha